MLADDIDESIVFVQNEDTLKSTVGLSRIVGSPLELKTAMSGFAVFSAQKETSAGRAEQKAVDAHGSDEKVGTRSPGHVIRDIVGVTVGRDQFRFPLGVSVGSTCFAADVPEEVPAQSAPSQYDPSRFLASECCEDFILRKCGRFERFVLDTSVECVNPTLRIGGARIPICHPPASC